MKIDISNLKFIHSKLRKIAISIEEDLGIELTITSLYRMNDSGVHGSIPLRGMDLRMRNRDVGRQIVKYINEKWIYDPEREHIKCAMIHNVGLGLHIHLQVHPNTEEVESG